MKPGFRVTYDIVTPESAEHGDVEESGFVMPGEWHYNIEDETPASEYNITLREALRLCNPNEDSGNWWSDVDPIHNYRTGAEETRSLHPPRNITPSSYDRITRLLGIKQHARI